MCCYSDSICFNPFGTSGSVFQHLNLYRHHHDYLLNASDFLEDFEDTRDG